MLRNTPIFTVYKIHVHIQKSIWKSSDDTVFFLSRKEAEYFYRDVTQKKRSCRVTYETDEAIAVYIDGENRLINKKDPPRTIGYPVAINEFNNHLLQVYKHNLYYSDGSGAPYDYTLWKDMRIWVLN